MNEVRSPQHPPADPPTETPSSQSDTAETATAQTPADSPSEEDWGIAPKRPRLSRETKLGFAFVLVLVTVFGFVVYKKIEHNRIPRGDLLADEPREEDYPEQPTPVESSTDPENPIAENSPPDQNLYQFPEPAPVNQAELTPASWDQESFEPPPQQELAENTPSEPPTESLDQFPAGLGNEGEPSQEEFAPPVEAASVQEFPPEPQFETEDEPPPVPTEAVEFDPNSLPQNDFAQLPPSADFEPPAQKTEPPAEPASEDADESDANPFGEGNLPEQTEPEPELELEDDNELFSTQSQPAPPQPEPEPAEAEPAEAGNPFGDFPGAVDVAEPPAQTVEEFVRESTQESESSEADDPFATPPPDVTPAEPAPQEEPTPASQEEPVPVEPAPDFDQDEVIRPVPELAEPNPLPTQDAAPAEISVGDDPRFGDFEPAPNRYEPEDADEDPRTTMPFPIQSHRNSGDGFGQGSGSQAPGEANASPAVGRSDVYEVRPGDNYWVISKKQYGTVRYFKALARHNQQQIPDPKKMRPGMKVLTPRREVLESRHPDLFPQFAANRGNVANVGHRTGEQAGFFTDANGTPMYRVGQNDTLGGIAQKHLGRFSRWVEIYQLNRHRLKDPNALTLGDVLQLPPDARQDHMVRHASGIR